MTDKYAVFGNPISHSKSPLIHTEFAKQTNQDIEYIAVLADEGKFAEAVKEFVNLSGKGLNVTVPFKQDAWDFVSKRNPNAEKAGAVNTIIVNDNGEFIGDNTDGVGLVRDITSNLGFDLKGKRVLILGAGGAVRGVLGPLLKENPTSITIANRTVSKAVELAELFADEGNITGVSFDDASEQSFDLIINGTAASLSGELPPIVDSIYKGAYCYDMMYGENDTVFMAHAKKCGAKQAWDGLGMLIEQAAESFYLWRGVRVDTGSVMKLMRTR